MFALPSRHIVTRRPHFTSRCALVTATSRATSPTVSASPSMRMQALLVARERQCRALRPPSHLPDVSRVPRPASPPHALTPLKRPRHCAAAIHRLNSVRRQSHSVAHFVATRHVRPSCALAPSPPRAMKAHQLVPTSSLAALEPHTHHLSSPTPTNRENFRRPTFLPRQAQRKSYHHQLTLHLPTPS